MRLLILAFLLLLTIPSRPGNTKLVVDQVDVKDVYMVYNGDQFGEQCNVVMFAEACYSRGWNPNHLSRVIEHESGYDLTARNRKSGATGLIQFMPATARNLGTTVQRVRTMQFEDQLKLTMRYLENVEEQHGSIEDSVDIYLAVFWPLGIKKRNEGYSRFIRAGSPAYDLNLPNDVDKDGDIDVWDIGSIMSYDPGKIDTISILREIRFVRRMEKRHFDNDLGL